MATSLPSGMAWPAMVSIPALGSGREVRTMEDRFPSPETRKSSGEKEMTPVAGPFLEKAATDGTSWAPPNRAAEAGRARVSVQMTASAVRRRERRFKEKTSFGWAK